MHNNEAPAPIRIDGSTLEGGGQVVRVGVALSSVVGVPFCCHSIRANRPVRGLGRQHVVGIALVAQLCNASTVPEEISLGGNGVQSGVGLEEFSLLPPPAANKATKKGNKAAPTPTTQAPTTQAPTPTQTPTPRTTRAISADIASAGACTLLLQSSLPWCLLGQPTTQTTTLTLRGGTDVDFSPPLEYLRICLLPLLVRMGMPEDAVRIECCRRGYYPRGGGEVRVEVRGIPQLQGLVLAGPDRGDVASIRGVVFGAGAGNALRADVVKITQDKLHSHFGKHVQIHVVVSTSGGQTQHREKTNKASDQWDKNPAVTAKFRREKQQDRALADWGVVGVCLVLETKNGAVLSADLLAQAPKRGAFTHTAPEISNTIVGRLVEAWDAGGWVDEHTMDQLVVFMALACGRSEVICNGKTTISSLHVDTAVHVASRMTSARFVEVPELAQMTTTAEGTAPTNPCRRIVCHGIGWRNPSTHTTTTTVLAS